jgi:hypothetical protein
MKRVLLPSIVSIGLLAMAPMARGSDASLEHALKAYKTKLTTDVAYLSSFSAPSKSRATATLRRLSKVAGDLAGATRAANGQQASTKSGRKGRKLVLEGLHDATLAVRDARASATAAKSGQRPTAKRDARSEQAKINNAIPMLEQGGKLLHLF